MATTGLRHLIVLVLLLLVLSARTAAQTLEIYVAAEQETPAKAEALLPTSFGFMVRVSTPAIATVSSEEVVTAEVIEDSVFFPSTGGYAQHYSISLDLSETALSRLREALNRTCSPRTFQIVLDKTIISAITAIGCIEPAIAIPFTSREAVESFTKWFSPKRTRYRTPAIAYPTPNRGAG